jgi:hypothetical protein
MVSTRAATAEEIAQYLLEIAEDRSVICRLWTRDADGVAELWLLTEPIDVETETRLRSVRQQIQENFPATRFTIRLLNPRLSDSPDLEFLVPRDARRFTIH